MIYVLSGDYLEDDSLAMLRYFGPGQGPRYCGEFIEKDGFENMLKFSDDAKVGDFIYVKPGIMACRQEVKIKMDLYEGSDIQFLPMNIDGIDLFLMNVTNVIDVLDHDKTVVKRLPDGRIMKLDPCFINDRDVPSCFFFKVPENVCKAIYGTEKLKSFVEENEFLGLRFTPLPATI